MCQPTPLLDRGAKRYLAVIRHVEEVTGKVATPASGHQL